MRGHTRDGLSFIISDTRTSVGLFPRLFIYLFRFNEFRGNKRQSPAAVVLRAAGAGGKKIVRNAAAPDPTRDVAN